jgi:putative FmdB family regulatory protein
MPIYEYRCQSCGRHMEVLQRMSEPALRVCKHCGAEALEKLVSQTSFQLKGTGWYATDYKSSGKPASESASSTADSSSGSSSKDS